jgi:hypothetical protein
LTKEQQKALETANRRKFVNNIAIVAMTDILDQAENIRKTLDVKMRYQNYNRYIHLHKYCFDVSLLFYKDGNIVIKIKDQTTGANYNEVLFEYSTDEKEQERALDMVDMLVTWLVPRFVEVELTEIHTFVSKIIQYDLMNLCAMEMEEMESIEADCN